MKKMPFRPELQLDVMTSTASTTTPAGDWRQLLPVLTGEQVVLRELRHADAPALLALLSTTEVSRFISPPPTTLEGFERFIGWAHRQRAAGAHVCFAVTLKGYDTAIGLFQVRQIDLSFDTAEWGFAIGSEFWGTGVFRDAAEAVLTFSFETLGVHRLEARAAVLNGRGNGALVKIGAVQEALLRKSFLRNGQHLDQVLYSIVEEDWRAARRIKTQTNIRFGNGPVVH